MRVERVNNFACGGNAPLVGTIDGRGDFAVVRANHAELLDAPLLRFILPLSTLLSSRNLGGANV